MLTKHNYKPSDVNIGTGSKIFDCCRKDPPDDPKCTDCCYDTWQDELKQVTTKYTSKVEEVNQMEKRLGVITDRRNRFKKWIDELNEAEEKSRAICHQLDILAAQSEKIWYNSCKANEAIEILYCMIRDFYFQVDEIKRRYDQIQNCVNSNNDPALVKDQGILKCLGEYYKKLDEVMKTRADIVKAIVEAISLAQLIRNSISTKDCPCGDDKYNPCDKTKKSCDCSDTVPFYGFKTIICEWYCDFACWEDCKPCKDDGNTTQTAQTAQASPTQAPTTTDTDPCKQDCCPLTPCVEFPICNDPYKCKVEKWYEKDDGCVRSITEKLRDAKKEKEALAACKTSLENAIKEVNPKDRCK